jgi:hypothetical protein
MSSLECLLHPHHISLVDVHSLRAKLRHAGDAYYNIDGLPSHRGVQAPKFDIFEIDGDTSGWLLVGNVPGVKSKEEIRVEWVDGTTIFIRGTLATASIPTFGETESKILKTIIRKGTKVPLNDLSLYPRRPTLKA